MTPRGAALLDVNVLVAIAWPNHLHHASAMTWFKTHSADGWATTPVTEAGFVRVSSNRAMSLTVTTPGTAIALLRRLAARPGHRFWPDAITGVVGGHVDPERLTGHQQVTDAHLLAIAIEHQGRLVTFDTGIGELSEDGNAIELLGAT